MKIDVWLASHAAQFRMHEKYKPGDPYNAERFVDPAKYGTGKSNGYTCDYQGITSGWGDWYYKQLPGQWIDITGVPEGDYIVRVTINKAGIFDEGENRYPDVVETRIHVPDPRNKVDGTWHK